MKKVSRNSFLWKLVTTRESIHLVQVALKIRKVGAILSRDFMRTELKRWLNDHSTGSTSAVQEKVITLREAAQETGLSVSALRKYETAGLIIFQRTSGNARILNREDLDRIRLIQHLIKNKGLNFEGIRRLWALLPCWEFRECTVETRSKCAVPGDAENPCWVIQEEKGGCEQMNCRHCEVYRVAANCTEDLKSLVHSSLVTDHPVSVEDKRREKR